MMIPAAFEYRRASSVSEALSLMQQLGDDARLLAGGHSLIPTMKLRLATPGTLIDIGALSELNYVRDHGGHLAIGACATHWMLESSDLVAAKAPALKQAAASIGDVQIRNRGTIGGALAHADPQADYPGAVLALNAVMVAQVPSGQRTIDASDYFTGLWETALNEGELLTEIRVPTDRANANSCYLKFPQPASRYPYVGCAVALNSANGVCSEIRIGFSGVGEWAFRDSPIEDALRGRNLNEDAISHAAGKAADGRAVLSDAFVSEEYRRAMAKVFAKRAISRVA